MPANETLNLSSRAIVGSFYETLEQGFDTGWPNLIGWMNDMSDQESETYNWLGMSPAMREWIGGRQAKGLRTNGLTIINKKFEATLQIAVDDIRRDKTGQIMVRVAELAERVNSHWASLLSTLIKNGDTDTNGTCYDGQYFFDTDHSEGDSGTLSNAITASDYGDLNVTTAANPTPEEMAKVIMKMVQHQYSFLDDQGEPLNENARRFALMVPIGMWGAAQQAVQKDFVSTGSGAIDNPLKTSAFSIDAVIANPRLDWTAELALFRVDGRVRPFILQSEQGLTTSMIAEGSEHEFENDEWLFGVKAIRNVGYGMWQHAVKATLS